MRIGSLLTLVVGLLMIAACEGSSTSSNRTPPAANTSPSPQAAATPAGDDALAASALMTRDDFPRDYLEKKRVSSPATEAISACVAHGEQAKTGAASTDDWLFDGQSPAISESVAVFANDAAASARVAAATDLIDCVVSAINTGRFDDATVTLSGASSYPVVVDVAGAMAFGVRAPQTFAGASGSAASGTAQYTFALVAKGRVVCELFVRGSGEPFDPDELSGFVQAAADRIADQ